MNAEKLLLGQNLSAKIENLKRTIREVENGRVPFFEKLSAVENAYGGVDYNQFLPDVNVVKVPFLKGVRQYLKEVEAQYAAL